jgi:putative intracellular protease/amidase
MSLHVRTTEEMRVDGKLVTGQNPASSAPVAAELLKLLHAG